MPVIGAGFAGTWGMGLNILLHRSYGEHPWTAWAAPSAGLALGVGMLLILRIVVGDHRPRPAMRWAVAVLVCWSQAVVLHLALDEMSGRSPAVTWLVIATFVAGVPLLQAWFGRMQRRSVRDSPRSIAEERHAAGLVADCERILAGPLKPKHRRQAERNLVQALITQAMHTDQSDGLVRATDLLQRQLAGEDRGTLDALLLAEALVAAMDRKADKHGDLQGYAEALEILAQTGASLPPECNVEMRVCRARALYHFTMAGRAGPPEQASQHADLAVAMARRAVELAPRAHQPDVYTDLAYCLGRRCGDDLSDLDEAVEWCERARQRLRRRPRERAWADTVLAELHLVGAKALDARDLSGLSDADQQEVADTVAQSLMTAILLSEQAVKYGGSGHRRLARGHLARAMALAERRFHDGPSQEQVAAAWRAAAEETRRYSLPAHLDLSLDWTLWTLAVEVPELCVEAFTELMRVVPQLTGAQYLPEERDRVLLTAQHVAAEAGYWLLLAGREREAVVALELGRAVAMSEDLVRNRLLPSLAARGAVDRAGSHAFSSPAQRVWADLDRLRRETGAGRDVDFAQIAAAAVDGPLVYLASAGQGGYAVIIPVGGGEPAWRRLPDLTDERVREQADRYLAAMRPGADPPQREVVHHLLPWLWEHGLRDLAAELPAGALVTLVPVGVLGLLPVHAAGGPAAPGAPFADWDFLLDRVLVRYAPNARILAEARRRAAECENRPLTLLTMDAPDALPDSPLRYARHETAVIAARWRAGGNTGVTLPDASGPQVLAALPRHSVWHWSCHAQAWPDDILQSALHLQDGPLRLRDLLDVPESPRRLAVLSACDSHVTGRTLPDEAVSLPGGLMQIGVAGVVATYWRAHDQAAVFVTAKFYELWRERGLPPPAALAHAQRWLRRATQGELDAYLPGVLIRPKDPVHAERWSAQRVFDVPYRWALFAFSGV
ncbi:hypothetical protein GCM10009679_26080 [Saccharothrix algeriensis]|uniref:CHAT domain-containing protein n=2 Tax=Catellatospora bangladeshensis TaxID=310355 RepID=A0A8J3JIT4_9ACTN|nr:hypothetical protein Cba03nite_27850 [Catellatospora bangladeshensis]